jgi:enoyl-CoA hydratase/carnithine racemase
VGLDSDRLLVESNEGVVTLTLNRPARHNALDVALLSELSTACRSIAGRHPHDRVVVLTGAGGTFCSGADLGDHSADDVPRSVWMRSVGDVCRAVKELPQPVIAKVRGVAAGGGLCLALCADLVAASTGARFAPLFGDRGLSVDFGGSWLLPRLVGLAKAKELILIPDVRSADEVHAMGLIARVVPDEELDGIVQGWASRLTAGPPLALAGSKRLLDAGMSTDLGAALESEAQVQAVNLMSRDGVEAIAAFAERRVPRFEGR